jgi:NitT/TauT family transport system substrate-binding protein
MTLASRRFNRLSKYAVSSVLALGSFCAFTQAAHAADPEKITIMVGGITKLIYLPARLTEQL